jgi:hypothetical protein
MCSALMPRQHRALGGDSRCEAILRGMGCDWNGGSVPVLPGLLGLAVPVGSLSVKVFGHGRRARGELPCRIDRAVTRPGGINRTSGTPRRACASAAPRWRGHAALLALARDCFWSWPTHTVARVRIETIEPGVVRLLVVPVTADVLASTRLAVPRLITPMMLSISHVLAQ